MMCAGYGAAKKVKLNRRQAMKITELKNECPKCGTITKHSSLWIMRYELSAKATGRKEWIEVTCRCCGHGFACDTADAKLIKKLDK